MNPGDTQKTGVLFPVILVISLLLHLLPLWIYRDNFTARQEYTELSLIDDQPVIDIPEPVLEKREINSLKEIQPTPIETSKPEIQKPAPIPELAEDLAVPDFSDFAPQEILTYEPPQPPSQQKSQQDTVDIQKHQRYFSGIRSKINRYKKYPAQAKRRQMEGDISVRFTLHRDGTVSTITAASNGKQRLLEQSAIEAVRRSSPFQPLPATINQETIVIRIVVHYRLSQ